MFNQFSHSQYRIKSLRVDDHQIDNFTSLANEFMAIRSDGYVSEYEKELFERILPLQYLTKSEGLVLYWVDNKTQKIQWKQSDVNFFRQKVNIPLSPTGHVAGATAYNKGEYLIQDVELFSRRYDSMIIDRDRPKNSILFYPILTCFRECLAVVELFRNDDLVYTTCDCQYVAIVLKWVGLSLQQANEGIKRKNEQDLNQVLVKYLLKFVTNVTKGLDFLTFMNFGFKMMFETLHAEDLFFYDVRDDLPTRSVINIYTIKYDKSSIKPKLQFHLSLKDLPPSETYIIDAMKNHKIINKKVHSDDPKINLIIRQYMADAPIESILYLPFIYQTHVHGVAVFLNTKKRQSMEYGECSEQQIALLEKICYFFGPSFHFRSTFESLNREYYTQDLNKEVFTNAVLIKKSYWTNEVEEIADVEVAFPTFDYNPESNPKTATLTYYIFCKITNFFEKKTLKTFITANKKAHMSMKYHNFYTTFVLTHTLYVILNKIGNDTNLSKLEKAALLTACLGLSIHNIGCSQAILEKTRHPIFLLYGKNAQKKWSLELLKFSITKTKLIDHHPKDVQEKFLNLIHDLFVNYSKYLNSNLREDVIKLLDKNELDFTNNENHRKLILSLILFCSRKSNSIQLPNVSTNQNKNLIEERNEIKLDIRKHGLTDSGLIKSKNCCNTDYLARYEIPQVENIEIPHYRLLVRVFPTLSEIITLAEKYRANLLFQITLEGKRVWIPEQSRGVIVTSSPDSEID